MILNVSDKIKDLVQANDLVIMGKEKRVTELNEMIDEMIKAGKDWSGTTEENERNTLEEELDDMYYLQERAGEALAMIDRINTTEDVVEVIDILTDHYSYKGY